MLLNLDEVRFLDMSVRQCERTENALRAEMPFVRVTRVQYVQCSSAVRDFYDMARAVDPAFEPPADALDAEPRVAMPPGAFLGWLPCSANPESIHRNHHKVHESARAALDHCPARADWLPPGTHQLILCVVMPTNEAGRAYALMRLLVTLEEHDSRLVDSPLLEAMFF